MTQEKLIGVVIHYFPHVEVAIIKLSGDINIGDNIKIEKGSTSFEQVVESMEVDRKKIEKAEEGDEVGLKVKEKVKEGYRVYKV